MNAEVDGTAWRAMAARLSDALDRCVAVLTTDDMFEDDDGTLKAVMDSAAEAQALFASALAAERPGTRQPRKGMQP
jgi:hypothetical protein